MSKNGPPEIEFNQQTYQYLYQGTPLTSISRVLGQYKQPFDSEYWSAKKAQERGVSAEVILQEWQAKADRSKKLGNMIHLAAESYIANGHYGQFRWPKEFQPHFQSLQQFFTENQHVIFETTEQIIGSPEIGIAGRYDFTYRKMDGPYLADLKTNKEIKTENIFEQMKPPLTHLDDCNYNHYALQLSLLRYLAEQEQYFDAIQGQTLVWIHENGYQLFPIDYMQDEIEAILKESVK